MRLPLPPPIASRLAMLALCGLAGAATAEAQHVPFPSYRGDAQSLDRFFQLIPGEQRLHPGQQPATYGQLAEALAAVDSVGTVAGPADARAVELVRTRLGLQPMREAVPDRRGLGGWLGRSFYRVPGYALHLRRRGFELFVNPVLDVRVGVQSEPSGREGLGGVVMRNTRGLTVRGGVDERVWFATTLHENQARMPSYERAWRAAYADRVPGVGFYKDYDPVLFDADDAVDYFQATGVVGVGLTRHISAQFGHGNPRVGRGYRSLVLDDFADPFLYAQVDTRVWRIHYRNLFAQHFDGVPNSAGGQRKFLAAHTLSVQLTPAWTFGLTEMTVFARERGGFDAQYLNPIILYRPVEQDNGSPDNALLAFHTDVRLGRGARAYGQFVFDEFKFDEFFGGRGWWGNKYAWQLGAQLFDPLGVEGLAVRAEYNLVRPFTYGQRRPSISYTHYAQPLAHPWGADVRELALELDYRPGERWLFGARAVLARQGSLAARVPHNGANVLVNNALRGGDFGFATADEALRRAFGRARLQYAPIPGAALRLDYVYYGRNDLPGGRFDQHGVTIGVGLNAERRSGVF